MHYTGSRSPGTFIAKKDCSHNDQHQLRSSPVAVPSTPGLPYTTFMNSTYWKIVVAVLGLFLEGCRPDQTKPSGSIAAAKLSLSLLHESDGTFSLPWLSIKNVDVHVAELNRRNVRRIELQRNNDRLHSELLRKICSGCQQLTHISIQDCVIETSAFCEMLSGLPELSELEMRSCRLTAADGSVAKSADLILSEPTQIVKLVITDGRGLDNDGMAAILTGMPELEELSVSDFVGPRAAISGKGWPFNRLTRLRKLTLKWAASDDIIRQAIREIPSLESITLSNCNELSTVGWLDSTHEGIRELRFYDCDKLTDEHLGHVLAHTPNLKSFHLTRCDGVSGADLDLTPFSDLRELHLSGHQLDGQFVADALASLNKLESVALFGSLPHTGQAFDLSRQRHLKAATLRSSCRLETLPESIETLSVDGARTTNSSIATMLGRLVKLQSLKLYDVRGSYRKGAAQVTGAGWDFSANTELRNVELFFCKQLTDELFERMTRQATQLESLRVTSNDHLTGRNWKLERLANLHSIRLYGLKSLDNDIMKHLPTSIETLELWAERRKFPLLTGEGWDFTAYPNLTRLSLVGCKSLRSIGAGLPPALQELIVVGAPEFTASDLDFSMNDALEDLNFNDCFKLNVDRLFVTLPDSARSLRRLSLSGSPDLESTEWDLSPLGDTLQDLIYNESEPAYVGGIGEANLQRLQTQLPDCNIISL